MAVRLQSAQQNYHDALHIHGGPSHGPSLEEARQEYIVQQQALDAALSRGQGSATLIRWAGILMIMAGIVVYVVKQFATAKA